MICKHKNKLFILALLVLVNFILVAQPLLATGEQELPEFISICDRTAQVRIAIQKEIAAQRFTSGTGGTVQCRAIKKYELSKISYLQIIEKDISSLKPGDFAGLEGLRTLDLEGNKLAKLNSSAFLGLTNLGSLILSRNPLEHLGDELSVLPNLKRLDLSGGSLSSISPGAFEHNPKLEAVFISENPLGEIPEGIFQNNDYLQIIDLSENKLSGIPHAFFPKENNLKSLNLSRNMISRLDSSLFSDFSELHVINVSGNPFETEGDLDSFLKAFDKSVNVITTGSEEVKRVRVDEINGLSFIPAPESPIAQGIEDLRFFVRANWHMPLDIHVSFSSGEQVEYKNPGLRFREERLLLRQLEEIREAYRRAAFDFFDVQINFLAPDSNRKAPVVLFDKKRIGFVIFLKMPASAETKASLISEEQLLETLADNFDRSRSIAWFKKETPENLEAALKRDFGKVARMDDELRFDIIRLDGLIETAMERMDQAGGKKFFSDTELVNARFIQFRVMLTFQRLENTIARWKLAEADQEFPYGPEVRLLLAQASETYRTYLDWFLNVVVGERATLNVLSKTWYK